MLTGGAFSRPNLVFNTAQPQLQFSTNPPAATIPSKLWPSRFGGNGSQPGNMFMPSIPEPEHAPSQAQNGDRPHVDAQSLTSVLALCYLGLEVVDAERQPRR